MKAFRYERRTVERLDVRARVRAQVITTTASALSLTLPPPLHAPNPATHTPSWGKTHHYDADIAAPIIFNWRINLKQVPADQRGGHSREGNYILLGDKFNVQILARIFFF